MLFLAIRYRAVRILLLVSSLLSYPAITAAQATSAPEATVLATLLQHEERLDLIMKEASIETVLNKHRTATSLSVFLDELAARLPKAEKEEVLALFKDVKTVPKLTRIGTAIMVGEGEAAVKVEMLKPDDGQYRVNGQQWALDPKDSFLRQVDLLFVKMSDSGQGVSSRLMSLLLPQAHAVIGGLLVKGAFVALKSAASAEMVRNTIIGTFLGGLAGEAYVYTKKAGCALAHRGAKMKLTKNGICRDYVANHPEAERTTVPAPPPAEKAAERHVASVSKAKTVAKAVEPLRVISIECRDVEKPPKAEYAMLSADGKIAKTAVVPFTPEGKPLAVSETIIEMRKKSVTRNEFIFNDQGQAVGGPVKKQRKPATLARDEAELARAFTAFCARVVDEKRQAGVAPMSAADGEVSR